MFSLEKYALLWKMNFEFRDSDEFRESAKQIEEFKYTLLRLHGLENQDFFYYAILCAICYHFKNKKNDCQNENQLKQDIENDNLYDTCQI